MDTVEIHSAQGRLVSVWMNQGNRDFFFTFDEHNFDEDEHKASPIINDYRVNCFEGVTR